MVEKEIKIPKKDKILAELVGTILGDGCVSAYTANKNGVYQVRIAGNYIKDYDYIVNYLKPLVENIFNINAHIHKSKYFNGIYLTLIGKNLVRFFNNIGIKSGDKIKNRVGIPIWIKKDKKLLKSCIRGLFDTDGCLYELRPHWPGIFQLSFKNHNKKLLNDARNSLLELGFNVSKVTSNQIYITRKDNVYRFYKEIGSSNNRLLVKFKEFLKLNPQYKNYLHPSDFKKKVL